MVAERLSAVRARISAAATRAGRDPGGITLVAVGKAQPARMLRAAYDAGQRDFGENRAQELAAKVPELPADARWHFIGPLQRNKVRLVAPAVTLLHSMDRAALADAWARAAPAPPVLVEVNVGAEPQKAGAAPAEVDALVARLEAAGVVVSGLMAIPPQADDPQDTRPYFKELAALAARLQDRWPGLRELSMGMTDDFEVAIEEGATIIRVGRAIFGPRPG